MPIVLILYFVYGFYVFNEILKRKHLCNFKLVHERGVSLKSKGKINKHLSSLSENKREGVFLRCFT